MVKQREHQTELVFITVTSESDPLAFEQFDSPAKTIPIFSFPPVSPHVIPGCTVTM